MLVYHYHATTGVYLHITTEADENPLEPGRYLIPANSTPMTPPYASETMQAVFRDEAWIVEPIPPKPVIGKQISHAPQMGLFHNVSIKEALKGGIS